LFISNLEDGLPLLCDSNDLVEFGVYSSLQEAAGARKVGRGPEYIKLEGRGIVYNKGAVLKYARSLKVAAKKPKVVSLTKQIHQLEEQLAKLCEQRDQQKRANQKAMGLRMAADYKEKKRVARDKYAASIDKGLLAWMETHQEYYCG
jgi:hypothetical protein